MADETEKHISLKLMIDVKNNRVVFAEADRDFADIIFSFLTMPMGTIVRLLNKQPNPETIGSFTSLYRGVAELNTESLWNNSRKSMLLSPYNSVDTLIQKLKLNIDDTEPKKYNSDFCSVHLRTCEKKKDISFEFVSSNVEEADAGGVFVSSGEKFIVTDDFHIVPASFGFIHSLLENLGIDDLKLLHLKTVTVTLNEICGLLKLFLLSETTLTNMFLGDQSIGNPNTHLDLLRFKKGIENVTSAESRQINVKLIVPKGTNKVIYAEANEDFVNLMFSFLTMPVGLVVKLLGGKSSLKCVDNLYKSVDDLNVAMFMGSNVLKKMLVSPKLSPMYQCESQLLDVESYPLHYVHKNGPDICDRYFSFEENLGPNYKSSLLHLKDPFNGSYVKGPRTFMVTDNLLVTPLSPISIIDLLENSNLNMSSIEERVIHVGKEEALSLLQASLISSSAITNGLNVALKKPKQESHFN